MILLENILGIQSIKNISSNRLQRLISVNHKTHISLSPFLSPGTMTIPTHRLLWWSFHQQYPFENFLVHFSLLRPLSTIRFFYALASFTPPCTPPFLHGCLYFLCAHIVSSLIEIRLMVYTQTYHTIQSTRIKLYLA